MSKKKKKEKIIYYDDNSTIADMSRVNRKGEQRVPSPPRQVSSWREKWKTYWSAVKMMVIPMCVVLMIIGALYFLILLITGNLF